MFAFGGALPGLLLAWKWQQVQAPHSSTADAAVASGVYCCIDVRLRKRASPLQIADMGSVYQSLAVTAVDAVFIATATAFLSKGSSFGTQQYGVFPKYPGKTPNQQGNHLDIQGSNCFKSTQL